MVKKAVPIEHQQPEPTVIQRGIPAQRTRIGQQDLRRVRVTLPSPARSSLDSPDGRPPHIDDPLRRASEQVSRSESWIGSHRKLIVRADVSVVLLTVLIAQVIVVDLDFGISLSWPTQSSTWLFGLIVALGWLTALALEGVWRNSVLKNDSSEDRRILLASMMVFAGVGIVGYLTTADPARTLLLIAAPLGIAGLLVNHWLLRRRYKEFRRVAAHEHGVVMLGDRAGADALCAALREGLDARFEVNGVWVIGDQSPGARAARPSDPGPDVVLPIMTDSTGYRSAAALNDSRIAAVTAASSISPDDESARGLSTRQLIAKRTLDLAVAAIGLVLLTPLLIAAAVLILLADGGPVLDQQECVGRRERVFKRWTFRCSPFGAKARPAAVVASSEGAERIEYGVATTPIGRLLLRTGLACAPGLFNVLAGQMSVVGPRPIAPGNVTAQPLLVRPGLTGRWRLEDPSDANTEIDGRDVQNCSAAGDTRIIARSLKLAVTGRLRC